MNHGNVQTAVHFKTHFVRFERWHTVSRNWETTNVPILTYESEITQKVYKNREKATSRRNEWRLPVQREIKVPSVPMATLLNFTSIYSIFLFLRAKFPIFIYLFLNLLFGFS